MQNIDIFQPLQFGKETFHPQSYDEQSFMMHCKMEPGCKVPTHIHRYMDEKFTILTGEIQFTVDGKTIIKKAGEELFVAKGIPHAISVIDKQAIEMKVEYSPCADTHRMFEILTILEKEKPGSAMNMAKYFYLFPRLGLKEFSSFPSPMAMKITNAIATIMGGLLGWKKYVAMCKN